MPGGGVQADKLSGIEEESDIYEGFAPHVDYTNIPLSNESSPGMQCDFPPNFRHQQEIVSLLLIILSTTKITCDCEFIKKWHLGVCMFGLFLISTSTITSN